MGDILIGLGKALVAAVDTYRDHLAQAEAARQTVASQAADDLATVDGRPHSSDSDLP